MFVGLPLTELQQQQQQQFVKSDVLVTTVPLGEYLTFQEKVSKLKELFQKEDFSIIRTELLLEGFEEIEMDSPMEQTTIEGITSLETVQISCPSKVYNYGLKALSTRGDAPYHLGFRDLEHALSSVWDTEVLCDENREAIVMFLYKKFISKENLY
mmetsp:Transcript_29/g.50  ORF Transcript_29/g.50 Transcript_29/m.50 type:complete len:155 (+) Transcript_29:578-1042(+)